MTCNAEIFDMIDHGKREITLADKEGRKLISDGIGEVVMKQQEIQNRVRFKKVLCVPDLNTNLSSVPKFTDYAYKVEFDKKGALICKNREEIQMTAVRVRNAYYVKSKIMSDEQATTTKEDDIWHRRLGHANRRIVEEMKNEDLVIGMKESDKNVQCESCIEGKACRKVHRRIGDRRANKLMELWHMDLIGPIKPSTRGGKKYIFRIIDDFHRIDDYSRVIFVSLLQEKSEASNVLKKLNILKENETGMKLKGIRSDNGGEFIEKNLRDWFEWKSIRHELTPARTPQCNGVAERGNRTVIETTRVMLSDSMMPMDFWGEAVYTTVHIRNKIKSSVHGKTPYELWYGRKPNIKYMKRFGCTAYMPNKDGSRKKFEPKTTRGIFVGYAANNTYRIYIPQKGKIQSDCEVKFDESRNGIELLYNEEREECKSEVDLVIVGLDCENKDNETKPDEETEKNVAEMSEIGDNDYVDAIESEFMEENDIQNEDGNEDESNDIQEQEIETGRRGRPRGTTTEGMQLRRFQTQEEQQQQADEIKLRRSEKIKNKNLAMLIVDEVIPKTVQQARVKKVEQVETANE